MAALVGRRSDPAIVPEEAPAIGRVRRAAVDGIGTAFLLATIVGSGVMGERLAGGNLAVALLANSIATGAGLIGIILAFGSLSGAHLNPVVTITEAWSGRFPWADVPSYVVAQVIGAFAGVAAAHGMFGAPVFSVATRARSGFGPVLGEFVATLGLVLVVRGASRSGILAVAVAVGCYIAAAYWFTSSTSFANPAVTLARAVSDTFVGVRASDVPGFLIGQAAGAAAAIGLQRWVASSAAHPAG
jgi:glycerol uptake facilitator-like aquaporin